MTRGGAGPWFGRTVSPREALSWWGHVDGFPGNPVEIECQFCFQAVTEGREGTVWTVTGHVPGPGHASRKQGLADIWPEALRHLATHGVRIEPDAAPEPDSVWTA